MIALLPLPESLRQMAHEIGMTPIGLALAALIILGASLYMGYQHLRHLHNKDEIAALKASVRRAQEGL